MYRRPVRNRAVILAAVMSCAAATGGAIVASPAAAFVPAQTNWTVVQASGKIVWTLESVPFGYQGFRSGTGQITEFWHYLGHGPEISFPFTTLRGLAPPGSPVVSFPIRPVTGTLAGNANGTLTDGTTGGCSAKLTSLPNNFGRNATLNMASLDKRHLALWTTAEDPRDLLTSEPCATQLGALGSFPAAEPDQKTKPTVGRTPVSVLRIDPSRPANRGKRVRLNLRAEFNLILTDMLQRFAFIRK